MDPQWHESLELVVKKSAEHALALSWAHEAAQRFCANWNSYLMFPSIILSALVGAGSIGSSQLLPFEGSNTLVGLTAIGVSIIQTIRDYYGFARRAEAHRVSSLQYTKLHAYLSLQLSLPRNERKPAGEVIDYVRVETEKLSDVAPLMPQHVKDLFHAKFGTMTDFSMPPLLNGLEPVNVTNEDISLTPIQPVRPVVRVVV